MESLLNCIQFKKQIDAIPDFLLEVQELTSTNKSGNNDMITVKICIGLHNRNVVKGNNQKSYYAQFWMYTSEKEVLDFRRIL